MEVLAFVDESYEVAVESYIDPTKIEYIRLPNPAIHGDLVTAIISVTNGLTTAIHSDYAGFSVNPIVEIESFDDRAEVLFTTYVNTLTVVQAERFINTTADPLYNNLVILTFVSGNAILTTFDFTQIPTYFPALA
jgi:hypothetical protein